MKLSKSRLLQIIKEELRVILEQETPRRRKVFSGWGDVTPPSTGLAKHPGFERGKPGEPDYLKVPTGVEDTVPHDDPYRPKLKPIKTKPTRPSRGKTWFCRGARGDDVKVLQKNLAKAGFKPGKADGKFGRNTRNALLTFQKTNPDLKNDGCFGPNTQRELPRYIGRGNRTKRDYFKTRLDIHKQHKGSLGVDIETDVPGAPGRTVKTSGL